MIETGTLLQNRYLIEKQIGAGGMGAVYLAVDQRFDNHVAIKETFYQDDELGEAFEREARLLNGLHHPVLPHVSDYFSEADGHFLVMQFIEGEDVSAILKREGAFPAADVARWTDDLLDALEYLHSQDPPIIHRDIKPQNLKITTRGEIILLDFGLAKLNHDDTSNAKSVFGYSRKYSPLEQIQGTGTDARSDIFALAATSYHLLTGKAPLDALSRASAIVAGNPDPLPQASEINPEIPSSLASVLQSALALNPAQRFASARAMRQALEHAFGQETTEKSVESAEQPVPVATLSEPVSSPVEIEDFPALEAFADEANNAAKSKPEEAIPVAVSIPVAAPRHSTAVVETPTKVSPPRKNKSRFALAAVAALLIGCGLAAFYFITRANSSVEPTETPVVQTTPEPAPQSTVLPAPEATPEPLEAAAEPPPPEVYSASSLEDDEPAAAPLVKTTAEKREAAPRKESAPKPRASTNETAEKPKPAAKTPRSVPPPSRPRQTPGDGETRSRVVAPDIESIFTGRQSERNVEGRRDQISDEERREMRRQRREERRRRQNRNNFPF